jgi:ribosomal protein L37AE/L43A
LLSLPAGFEIVADIQVQRGTAQECGDCGGELEKLPDPAGWQCRKCGRAYG